jgi:multicomponent Na+:H+ antiporter subunit D
VNAVVLVILVPFLTAVALALMSGRRHVEQLLNAASCIAQTAFSFWLLATVDREGIQVTMLGGFLAPYGIAFVADRLACAMLCVSTSLASVVAVYTPWTVTRAQQTHFFFPLFQIMLLGVNWSFITGDLFNLFVAYEVLLLGSYGSMLVGASRQQVRQTMVYVAINLVGGAIFVVGVGLVYSLLGTLNMADIARLTSGLTGPRAAMVTAASMTLLFVFALKAGTFPLFFWLPDSYPVVPTGMNGYFAGLLTKVGIYSLLRVFVMTFRQEGAEVALQILLFASGFTMLLGVLGALAQWDIRRILAWHSVSQVGYMVMGIGLAIHPTLAAAAVAATVVFVVHHSIVKSSLFLIGGVTEEVTAARRLKDMGGTLELAPAVAMLFLVAALSLAGMPPFTGFLAKIALLRVGLAGESFWIVAVAVATSFFTLLSMLKIWSYAFWGTPRLQAAAARWRGMAAACALLVLATVGLGVWAQPLLRFSNDLAADVVDPRAYVAAVLGTTLRLAHGQGAQGAP